MRRPRPALALVLTGALLALPGCMYKATPPLCTMPAVCCVRAMALPRCRPGMGRRTTGPGELIRLLDKVLSRCAAPAPPSRSF
jgi:hypothetical protein